MTYYATGNVNITGGSGTVPVGAYGSYGIAGSAGGATWSTATLAAPAITITNPGMGYGGGGAYYTNTYAIPSVNITNNDIVIDGESLKGFMHMVQDRLAVLRPNPELEKEFDELRECAERYRELEKKFLEQQKVFNILKKQD